MKTNVHCGNNGNQPFILASSEQYIVGTAPSQYCEDLKDGLQQEQELVKRRKEKVVLYKEKNENMQI